METLRKLGYTINAGLEMRAISNGGRFVYTNEGNYAAIGEVISSFFESFLISEFGFLRHKIPISADPAESTTSVLLSRGAVNSELLLVIVPTHTVRGCGLWFRKACINDNLYIGSMINYIRDFIALGYKIILLNPNIPVSESRCPADHLVYVYDHIISKSISSSITWLCHQIGSQTLSHLLSTRPQVEAKSACYLLLDPVPTEFPDTVRASVFSKSRAWITTTETLGSVSRERQRIGCDAISLGTKSEILAPGAAQNLMFEWLRNQSNPALRRHFPTANIVRENSIRLEERERYWKRRLH
uniref:Arb2 domain-containing protein n=1 Tax=Arcella intermedia TaxID=1963864 RepID=A0A6B2LAS7_9EUKA